MKNEEIKALDDRCNYLVLKCQILHMLLVEEGEVSRRPMAEWFADVAVMGFDVSAARQDYEKETIGPAYFELVHAMRARYETIGNEIRSLPRVPFADRRRYVLETRLQED